MELERLESRLAEALKQGTATASQKFSYWKQWTYAKVGAPGEALPCPVCQPQGLVSRLIEVKAPAKGVARARCNLCRSDFDYVDEDADPGAD